MKKLAIIITQAEMGGAQKNILLLAERLKFEYDIIVYSSGNGGMVDELKKLEIKHVTVPHLVREISLSDDFKAYTFLTNEFKKEKFDIVHCHSSKAGIIGRQAATSAKIKNIIYTAHGFVFNEPMSNLKKQIYISAEKFEGHNCHHIICVNSKDIDLANEIGIKPQKSIAYVPNGIDFSNSTKVEASTKDTDSFVFGLVANFYETKGHRYLIDAFNKLCQKNNAVKLVLIGEGTLKTEMEQLAKDNKNIEFWGYRDNGMELMNNFDCFVLSSVKEGFPFVILEAIKNKVPIISTDVGAIREILDDGALGTIVSPSNSEELLQAMELAIENKELLKDKAEKAFESCKTRYSIETMVELTKQIYENA